ASDRDWPTPLLTNPALTAKKGQQGEFEIINNPKIGAIVFYVKDLSRTEKSYRDMLGTQHVAITLLRARQVSHVKHDRADFRVVDYFEFSLLPFLCRERRVCEEWCRPITIRC